MYYLLFLLQNYTMQNTTDTHSLISLYHPLPEHHFLYDPPTEDWPFYLSTFTVNGFYMSLIINPTDARKRLILRFIGQSDTDFKSGLSRSYTQEELDAFYLCVSRLMFKFAPLGVQLFYAGNNSQSVVDRCIVIGQREPSMLHVHLVMKFLLPLDQIGKEFSLMGPKEQWTDSAALQFRDLIRSYLD